MIPRRAIVLTAALLLAGCQGGAEEGAVAPAPPGGAQAVLQSDWAPVGPAAVAEGVTVTGSGRVEGRPDTLRATVGVQVTREDVDTAFDEAAGSADRVLSALREGGVAEEDIQTRDFAVNPDYDYREQGPPVITGYTVRNLVEVTIRDVDAAGSILAAVAEAAGDDARVEGMRFSLEDNAAQLAQARAAAFEDARDKAAHYAELAGGSLGALISVAEVAADRSPLSSSDAEMEDSMARAPGAPILPGEQEVGVVLQATWALR